MSTTIAVLVFVVAYVLIATDRVPKAAVALAGAVVVLVAWRLWLRRPPAVTRCWPCG